MQKKIVKLIKSAKEKLAVNAFAKDGKSFKNRVLFYKQQRLKSHRMLYRSASDVRKPFGRALAAMVRSLDISVESKLYQLPIMTNFWRAILPKTHRAQKERILWMRSAGEVSIPKLTRGFKASQLCSAHETDGPYERFIEDSNGEAEQRFYTEGPPLRDIFPRTKEQEEKDLPPPQRCRLSCPLPPEEFIPPGDKDFFPSYQPPSVRFSSLPSEFLPPAKESSTAENISMKSREHNYANKRNVYTLNIDLPDFLPNSSIKNRKNYLNLKQVKSRLYKPQPEVVPKMKALTFRPESLELNFDSVNVPTQIFKDEVLVQVTYSGVCGIDLFITEGKLSCRTSPIILGHEISGKVYAAGSEVNHVSTGDHVAVNAYTACCVCRYCSRGFFSACVNDGLNNSIGFSKNGGWAEFVVVKKSQVYKIPHYLGLDQAALIQPLSCVLSALTKLNITHGMDVFILGLGLSGLLWASVLHSRGFKKVYVSDRNQKRKEQFESLNLSYTFVPMEDIGKYSTDVVIECTGSPITIEKAFNILNPNGQMCFFGKPNPVSEVRCIPYEIIRKEITLVGNAGNAFCFSKAVDLASAMGDQYLNFDKLGVKVFDLEDYREAFQLKKMGEVTKIMFQFDS